MNKVILIIFCTILNISAYSQNWKHLYKEDGIHIYGKDKNSSGIIPFKAEAYIEANFKEVFSVLKDFKSKTSWAPKLYKVNVHKIISKNEIIAPLSPQYLRSG